MNGRQFFGVAIYSKYPIVNKGYIPFESDVNNFCIYADLKIGKDTVRVYDAHLASIRLQREDYALVQDNQNGEPLEKGGKRIARRLKSGSVRRQEQVHRILLNIKDCRHPKILCGDFNDTPVSYCYETLTNELDDSFLEAGNGIGNTYIGAFPSFRIDYILHSVDFTATDYRTLEGEFSDHHAVTATLAY
jgi:endonuclease/exonuclease/phosphatase family metal-dependent hydrolase